jgi:integral membrane protein (TIGR00529 family)
MFAGLERGTALNEIIALFVGFSLIVVLLGKKVDVGTTMLTATGIIGLISGLGITGTVMVVLRSTFSITTADLVAVVAMICVIGHILDKYGVLDKMVGSLEELFRSTKIIIMVIPSILGVLFIPGGAILSAPMVGSLGDRLGIDGVKKSSINMIFRHAWFLIFPFSTSMILAARVGQINVYHMIRYTFPVTAVSLITGYLIFVRSYSKDQKNQPARQRSVAASAGRAVLYTSPIWIGILINIAFGLPFSLAILPGIPIIYFIGEGEKKGFVNELFKGINLKMLFSVIGIMSLQGMIGQMSTVRVIVDRLITLGADIRIIMVIAAALVGFLTASNPTTVGMLFPVFLPFAQDYQTKALFASLILSTGYLFYFVSPLHLCQIFTAEYYGIKVSELYRDYRLYWIIVFTFILILFLLIY